MVYSILAALAATVVVASPQEFLVPTPAKGTPSTAIPRIGLGTARVKNATEVVAEAIVNGYRHIDAAFQYGNQREVGLGIKEGLKRTGLQRSDLWITSKLGGDRYALRNLTVNVQLTVH
jgi:alcohol dehydrogenase (NADP+)